MDAHGCRRNLCKYIFFLHNFKERHSFTSESLINDWEILWEILKWDSYLTAQIYKQRTVLLCKPLQVTHKHTLSHRCQSPCLKVVCSIWPVCVNFAEGFISITVVSAGSFCSACSRLGATSL